LSQFVIGLEPTTPHELRNVLAPGQPSIQAPLFDLKSADAVACSWTSDPRHYRVFRPSAAGWAANATSTPLAPSISSSF